MKKYATQFHNKTIAMVEGHTERTVFFGLASLIAVSFILYMFFVGTTILNIVDRKSLENENRNLGSRVGELELSYFSVTNKVDLKLAYSLGFKDAGSIAFASKNTVGKTLSLAEAN